jgi:hypothetical protein
MTEPTAAERRAQARIARQLAEIGFALPGTLIERRMSCGKPSCRCQADPPQLHGPYHQWTRTIDGKTRTRNLTDEQVERYGDWFDNARRIRELLDELQTLSLRIFERADDDT